MPMHNYSQCSCSKKSLYHILSQPKLLTYTVTTQAQNSEILITIQPITHFISGNRSIIKKMFVIVPEKMKQKIR